MCYWRRLSKRSVDDFDYEYTTNSSRQLENRAQSAQPVISDSLNLFKALQVRQESEPTRSSRQQARDIYAEDEEASLICYRHTEVFIFLTTIVSLLLLVITVAITCCLRVRKLTRNQYAHNRLASSTSLSPSLLSISDVISSAGSLISNAADATAGGNLLGLGAKHGQAAGWHSSQQSSFGQKQHQPQARPKSSQHRPPTSSFHSAFYPCSPQISR